MGGRGAGRAGAELGGVELRVRQFEGAREVSLESALRGVGEHAGGDDGHVVEEPFDVVSVRAGVEAAQQGELSHVVDGAQLRGRGKSAEAGQGVVARGQGAAERRQLVDVAEGLGAVVREVDACLEALVADPVGVSPGDVLVR